MKVKVKLKGMLIDARIEMQGDMMIVSPISDITFDYNIKNGELIVLVSKNGQRTLFLANMVSDGEDGPVLHYHASMTFNGNDFEEHGQISLLPFTIDKPTDLEKWDMYGKLSENNLIWDKENGGLTNFNAGDIVTCNFGESPNPYEWICVCESFERMTNNYYLEEICGIDNNNGVWLEHGYSDAAQSIRLATQEEKEKLFNVLKGSGYKWNEQTRKLESL